MSRSYKKFPFNTKSSEKEDKQLWHRRFRRVNKIQVSLNCEPIAIRSLSNKYDMTKDGSYSYQSYTLYPDKRVRALRK